MRAVACLRSRSGGRAKHDYFLHGYFLSFIDA
jgi:hypothetical protein